MIHATVIFFFIYGVYAFVTRSVEKISGGK